MSDTNRTTWCDNCLNYRPCRAMTSGIVINCIEMEIHLCQWCRGQRTRRAKAAITKP